MTDNKYNEMQQSKIKLFKCGDIDHKIEIWNNNR